MIFTPLPGEYIASAVRRGNETLGIKGIKKAEYYIKKKAGPQGKFHKEHIIEYPTLFEEHRVTEEVLHENTLYPLAAALGRTRANCIYTPTKSWKICLHCVIEDLNVHGTAYIHRRHLPNSVSTCSKHASKLYEKCPTCLKLITQHEINGLSKCRIFFQAPLQNVNSTQHLYAKFTDDLLTYNKKSFQQHHIEIMLYSKLQEIGYLDSFGHLNVNTLKHDINNKLGLSIKFQSLQNLTLNACAASAFLAYQRCNEYLTAVNDCLK